MGGGSFPPRDRAAAAPLGVRGPPAPCAAPVVDVARRWPLDPLAAVRGWRALANGLHPAEWVGEVLVREGPGAGALELVLGALDVGAVTVVCALVLVPDEDTDSCAGIGRLVFTCAEASGWPEPEDDDVLMDAVTVACGTAGGGSGVESATEVEVVPMKSETEPPEVLTFVPTTSRAGADNGAAISVISDIAHTNPNSRTLVGKVILNPPDLFKCPPTSQRTRKASRSFADTRSPCALCARNSSRGLACVAREPSPDRRCEPSFWPNTAISKHHAS